MKAFITGLILGLIAIPIGVYFYFATGSAPVATSAQAMPFEKMLAHKALNARVEKEMPHNVPVAADEATYRAGAQLYRDNCAICHGLSDGELGNIPKGMFPRPPKLLQGKGVTDDEPGETYWKIANGIRMTGMPAFNQSMSEVAMWQVSLLVAHADKLPDSVRPLITNAQNPPPLGNIVVPSGPLTFLSEPWQNSSATESLELFGASYFERSSLIYSVGESRRFRQL